MTQKDLNGLFSGIHYFITLIFFIILLVATIFLTISTNEIKNVKDPNATKGKNVLIFALAVGWTSIAIVTLGLIGVGIMGFRGNFALITLKNELTLMTGKDKLFVSLRIIIFSVVVIGSTIMGLLCFWANRLLKQSVDVVLYFKQIELTERVAEAMILHTIVLIFIQFVVFLASSISNYVQDKKSKKN